jgi:hypothetical protein
MTVPAYSLYDFNINGITIQARPSGWDGVDEDGCGNDINGNIVYPNEWVTTCPHCGYLVYIKKAEVYISTDNTQNSYRCDNCDAGKPQKSLQFVESSEPETATFLDPIESGLFSIEYDAKLLAELDELAKSS